VVVSRSGALARRAAGLTKVEAVIKPRRTGPGRYLQGLRPHQWLKNLLVFLPLMPVLHDLTQALMVDAVLAFVAFSLRTAATTASDGGPSPRATSHRPPGWRCRSGWGSRRWPCPRRSCRRLS
jgi:hypothetical protein